MRCRFCAWSWQCRKPLSALETMRRLDACRRGDCSILGHASHQVAPILGRKIVKRITIVLARHGRPNFRDRAWIAPREMPEWLERFNQSAVSTGEVPVSTLEIAASSATIVSSTLRRSVQSARCLASNRDVLSEDVFCEAALPHTSWRRPRLPFSVWVVLFRVGWILGFSGEGESKSQVRQRARIAAERMIALARDSGSVLLVGHGIMNRLIARQLISRGWAGGRAPSSAYWGITKYDFLV